MHVDLALVRDVLPAVRAVARRTPLVPCEWLSAGTGRRVLAKRESLQLTGSFKLRGALAALARLPEPERGVFTVSTGNHGQALAFAAAERGVPCTVVVPRAAAAIKVERIRARGARVVAAPFSGYDRTLAWALSAARGEHREVELSGAFVSAYEDAAVAAGNGGTLALEVLEQVAELEGGAAPGTSAPALDAVVVPTGGGGLVVGVGAVLRALAPRTRVVAVNPEASAGMALSFREGAARLSVDSAPTVADAVEGGVGAENYRLARELVDEVVTVSEASIRAAMRESAVRDELVLEGAGALGLAALMEGVVAGERIAVLLTGGNVDAALLAEVLRG